MLLEKQVSDAAAVYSPLIEEMQMMMMYMTITYMQESNVFKINIENSEDSIYNLYMESSNI